MTKLTNLLLSGAVMMTTATTAFANDAVKTIREFYEVADARPMDAAKLRSFYADDFVDHDGYGDGGFADANTGTFAALADGSPDSVHDLQLVLPIGDDQVVVYWRYSGTNTNNLFGLPTTDPARKFDIAGIEIYTIVDSKITEMWHVEEIQKLVETLTGEE